MNKIAKLFACKLMLVVAVAVITGCGASAVSAPVAPVGVAPVAEVEPPGYDRVVKETGHGMPFGYMTIPTVGMSKISRATPTLEPVVSGSAAAVAAK